MLINHYFHPQWFRELALCSSVNRGRSFLTSATWWGLSPGHAPSRGPPLSILWHAHRPAPPPADRLLLLSAPQIDALSPVELVCGSPDTRTGTGGKLPPSQVNENKTVSSSNPTRCYLCNRPLPAGFEQEACAANRWSGSDQCSVLIGDRGGVAISIIEVIKFDNMAFVGSFVPSWN